MVNVEITRFPSSSAALAQGRVLEVLGKPGDFGLDVELINVGLEGPVAVNQGKVWGYPFGVGGLQWAAKKGEVVFIGGTMNEGSAYVTKPENAAAFKDLKNFKGKRVGTLKVSTAAGTPVAELPLVVLQPVEEAGIVGRAWDSLRLWIK